MAHHGSSESIDSRRTLADIRVHAYNLKVATSQDDPSTPEKDGNTVILPVHTQNTALGGPPTFGPGRISGRRAMDLGTAAGSQAIVGQAMGVNAINGVPAYYAQQQERFSNDQGPHKFHQNPRADLENQDRIMAYTSADPPQGSRQAPWLHPNEEESPSRATIVHAARVSQPTISLYPAHVVATGLTTRPIKLAKPPKREVAINELIRAAGLNQSVTSLPYLRSSSGHTRESDAASVGSGENEHVRSQSVETFVQAKPAVVSPVVGHKRGNSEGPRQKRVKGSRPRRRPPPLDLSALSNVASADRR